MTNLEVPGARLHYETRGSGPLLLMVLFKALAEHPAAQYTVLPGCSIIELPGGHLGFVRHPGEYARELMQPLARQNRMSGRGVFPNARPDHIGRRGADKSQSAQQQRQCQSLDDECKQDHGEAHREQ